MSETTYQTIRYDRDGAVATVTLDRPDRYNAFDKAMCDEMASVWDRIRHDDQVSAVVLTASGDKAFCTGVDRDFVPTEGGATYDFTPYTYDDPGKLLGPRANEVWKPVIGAVNGMACGGAFYLLGECDFLIAAEHATFFDPHVTYAMPAVYEPMAMMRRMPFGEVMRMTLTGNHERLSAQRALEIGLVSEVVPADELAATAATVAAEIASQPLGALMATVRTLWAAREVPPAVAESLGNTFLHLGMTEAAMDEGSKVFASGARIDPRIR